MKVQELTEFIGKLKKEGFNGCRVYLVKLDGSVHSIHTKVIEAQNEAEKISKNAVVQEFNARALLINQ